MKKFIFDVIPMTAPRMVHSDKWSKRKVVTDYFAFRDELRLKANLAKYEVKDALNIQFLIPFPQSWNGKKKKEALGMYATTAGDIDNYLKAFLDALCKNDRFVCEVHAGKYWGEKGCIIVYE